MKKLIIISGLMLAAVAGRAAIIPWSSGTLNQDITDGNAVGIFNTYTLATGGTLNSVAVNYTLAGGRAGDLLGYLILNNGGTTYARQLINRPGVGIGDPFGNSADSSTLSLAATDVTSLMGVGALNLGANSTWTLYLADMATGGGTAQLSNWGLNFDVSVVPEPATWALIIFGAFAGGMMVTRRLRRAMA